MYSDKDEVSEGEACSEEDWIGKWELQEMLGIPSPLSLFRKPKRKSNNFTIKEGEERYRKSKDAKVGDEICCGFCNKKLIKKSYQQAFCRTKCKDRFWNSVCPERRERAQNYKS